MPWSASSRITVAAVSPSFAGRVKKVHHSFQDPPRLAREAASEQEALDHYRRVRDEIRAFIETLPEALTR
jgi:arsenate reductase